MNCRICNNDQLNLFYEQGDKNQFKFYKCPSCGLVNLDLSELKIDEHQGKYFARFKPIENYENEKGAKAAYQFIKKYVPIRGDFLDIGCGGGAVLYFAKKDGWQVKGLEISPDYAKYVRERLQVEVYVADFMKFDNTDEQFDVVTLRHVLEHLPDSILAMNKISSLLKKGGYGHFEFPNINSLSHRIQRLFSNIKLHKKKYSESYQPGHCNEFSKETFCYLLKLTNFELVRWETYSFKPFTNFIYNRIKFGTKARAIVRKVG
jgi:SAM-dependent methyltransferase